MRLRQLFENIAGKTAVLGWGRGMGHKGHMLLAHAVIYYADKVQAEPFFVVSRTTLVDPSTGDVWADRKKSTPTKNDPLTPDEKLATYRKVFPDHNHIFTIATEDASTLVKIMGKLVQQGFTHIVLVVGEQEVAENEYLRRPDQSGVSPAQQAGVKNLEIMSRQDTDAPGSRRRDPNSPRAKEADYEEGPRATDMRKVLLDPTKSEEEQLAVWRKDMPHSSWRTDITGSVSDEEIVDLMRKAKARLLKAHTPAVRGKQGVAEDFDSENNPWHVTDVDAVSETDFEVALQGPGGIKLNFVIRPVDFVETQRERYQIDSMDVRDLQSGKTMHWGSMQNLGKWEPIFDAIDEHFWMDRSLQAHLAKIVDYYVDAGEHGKNPDMMPDLDKRDPNGIAVSAKDYIASHNQADTAIKSAKKK